mgnify:CR=1 FL=1
MHLKNSSIWIRYVDIFINLSIKFRQSNFIIYNHFFTAKILIKRSKYQTNALTTGKNPRNIQTLKNQKRKIKKNQF